MTSRRFVLYALMLTVAAWAQNTAEQWLSQAEASFEKQDWSKSEEAARAALQLNPKMADALVILALLETNRSHLEAAEQHLRNAAAIRPNDPRILSYLGSTCLREERYSEALAAFKKVLESDSKNAVASYNLGLISLVDGKPLDALRYFRTAADRNPSDVAANMGILESQLLLKDKNSAGKSARMLNSLIPAEDPERLRLVAMLIRYGDFQNAIPILEELRAADPKTYDLTYNLTLAYYRTARYEEAERTAGDLIKTEPRAEIYDLQGAIQEKLQQHALAMLSFQEAASREPGNEDYSIDYASAVLQHGSVQTAVAVWNSAQHEFPGSWRVLVGLGAAAYLSGEYDRAADALLEAAQLNAKARPIYALLGTLYEAVPAKQTRIKRAFETYLHLVPRDAPGQCEYGRMLYLTSRSTGNQNFEPAKIALRKALALDPHLAEADLQLAIIAQTEGHFEESMASLNRALAGNPRLSEAHYRLALAYRKLGKPDRAKAEMDAFLKFKSESREVVAHHVLLQLTREK